MTTRILRFLAVLAVASLAFPALAHEVDCAKTVGIVGVDRQGQPELGPDGLPLSFTNESAVLVLDQYPVTIGWRIRVENLAAETSIIGTFSDPLLATSTSVAGTLPAPGLAIAVGGATVGFVFQQIHSFEECPGTTPPPALAHGLLGPTCGPQLVNVATVVTESDIAQCRAMVVCKPQPPRLPAP